MGYQRRAASFSFMGTVPVGKTVEVVPNEDERAAVIVWPPRGREAIDGTVSLVGSEFARGMRSSPRRLRIALG